MKTLLRHTLLCMLLLALVQPIQAQSVDSLLISGKQMLQSATDPAQMQAARAQFERATSDAERATLAHYYVALADYRLANSSLEEDEAIDFLDDAVEHLHVAIAQEEAFAEAYALLSSVYGRKISFQPIKGILLGPKANSTIGKAKDLAPDNPRVLLIEAIGDFNTPGMFGGSKERAFAGFQRAITLFEQEQVTDPLQPSWGHDEAYAWLGLAYLDQDKKGDARRAFEQALAINPNNGWVQYQLLPQVTEASQ